MPERIPIVCERDPQCKLSGLRPFLFDVFPFLSLMLLFRLTDLDKRKFANSFFHQILFYRKPSTPRFLIKDDLTLGELKFIIKRHLNVWNTRHFFVLSPHALLFSLLSFRFHLNHPFHSSLITKNTRTRLSFHQSTRIIKKRIRTMMAFYILLLRDRKSENPPNDISFF